MSQHILTALYSRPEDATDAVARLEALGIGQDDISVISAETDTAPNWLIPTLTAAGIGLATAGPIGAVVGALVGGSLPVDNTGEPRGPREGTLVACGWRRRRLARCVPFSMREVPSAKVHAPRQRSSRLRSDPASCRLSPATPVWRAEA